MRVKGQTFKEGDWISLDGTTGRVIKGKLNTIPPKADDPELLKADGMGRTVSQAGSARQC